MSSTYPEVVNSIGQLLRFKRETCDDWTT